MVVSLDFMFYGWLNPYVKNLIPFRGYAIFVVPWASLKGVHVYKQNVRVDNQGCDERF